VTRPAALLTLALMLAGCASIERPLALASDTRAAQCQRDFAALDEALDHAGVRDAQDERIAGFPWLRVDRASAALATRAAASDAAFAAWMQRLSALDREARSLEIAHLPAEVGGEWAHLAECRSPLARAVERDPESRRALLANARVPDRYSAAARAAGLYALTRGAFFKGVQQWERDHSMAMRESQDKPRAARRLVPEAVALSAAPVSGGFVLDALGLPQLDDSVAERLLAAHAPVLELEGQAAFDAIGTPTWQRDGHIAIDGAKPVVYQRLTHTLVRGQALLQLVYTLWFPERPKSGNFDLLGGALDGVILRITLAPDGRPLMLDSIHACGCYHLFFPAQGVNLRPDAPADEEWAYVPAPLPAWQPGARFAVRIASATHYVLGVSAQRAMPADATPYARRPETLLRALPTPDGRSRSLYGPDGLVAGSERAERFLYWPMGIQSAGAMRQWGHHATAFVGRRHFDDANLLDLRFEFADLAPR
jgi:hypothetical protein